LVASKKSNKEDLAALVKGLAAMNLQIDTLSMDRLVAFCEMLRKWNRSYNLVSANDLQHLVTRHLLDSISIFPHLAPGSLLDVGTGAGFPGLPLAIVNQGMECTLLDSTGKKIRFLRHVKRTLDLNNVHLVEARAEDYESDGNFDNITSRAFSSIIDFAVRIRHLAGPATRVLAMKGRYPEDELKVLPDWLALQSVEKLEVPDLHAERHLVIMSVSP